MMRRVTIAMVASIEIAMFLFLGVRFYQFRLLVVGVGISWTGLLIVVINVCLMHPPQGPMRLYITRWATLPQKIII